MLIRLLNLDIVTLPGAGLDAEMERQTAQP
jgi:hypothetical protein